MAGSTTSVEVQQRYNWNQSGRNRNRFYTDMATTAKSKSAVPSSYYPPYTWIIPTTSGELGTGPNIVGTGTVSPLNLAGGVNGAAALTGSGDLTSAVGALVISMVANLTGSGNITAANIIAKAFMSGSLTGSGDISSAVGQLATILLASANLTGSGNVTTGNLGALAGMSASVTGSGTASGTATALGSISANILAYGSLTPEGIRDTVWNAVLANFPTSGTAGKTLTNAGSGGVDYATLAAAVITALNATTIPVDAKKMNGATVAGTGQPGDLWRGS